MCVCVCVCEREGGCAGQASENENDIQKKTFLISLELFWTFWTFGRSARSSRVSPQHMAQKNVQWCPSSAQRPSTPPKHAALAEQDPTRPETRSGHTHKWCSNGGWFTHKRCHREGARVCVCERERGKDICSAVVCVLMERVFV